MCREHISRDSGKQSFQGRACKLAGASHRFETFLVTGVSEMKHQLSNGPHPQNLAGSVTMGQFYNRKLRLPGVFRPDVLVSLKPLSLAPPHPPNGIDKTQTQESCVLKGLKKVRDIRGWTNEPGSEHRKNTNH